MIATPVASWRTANADWLVLALERLRLRLNKRALWLQRARPGETRAADWLLAARDTEREARFNASDSRARSIEGLIRQCDERLVALEREMRASSRPPALRALAEVVELTPFEEELILMAVAPALDGAFATAFSEVNDDPRRRFPTLGLGLAMNATDESERVLAADCLMHGRPLRALRLVDVSEPADEPLVARRLCADERFVDFLRGGRTFDQRVANILDDVSANVSNETLDRIADDISSRIEGQTARWPTVNLVGTSDGGAREVAHRVSVSLGLRLQELDVRHLAGISAAERAALFPLLGREALLGGLAYLIDTASAERGSPAASLVDELIERVAAASFVISAERWPGSGEAHRAAHVVTVGRPDRSEQRGLWHSALAAYAHSLNGELDVIAQQFDFGPMAIVAAVERARARSDGPITASALWRSCREEIGTALDDLATRVTSSFVWEDIVVRDDVRAQLRELADQVANRGRVYETWGFGSRLGRGRGITALFTGASGTGKTMAAEIIANHLELDLHRVDLAGLISKYVGETEKNIRRVFDAAERSGAILFFDEADALFGSRTEVRDSHDRYANVEINYLLQRMEDYAGLAILATNRRAALDDAFVRRLRFIIEFPFPTVDDRRRIWEGVFPPSTDLERLDYGFLARLELSGGSIRAIAVNAAFLAAAERRPVGMAHIVRASAREYGKLAKPISASDFGPYYSVARA